MSWLRALFVIPLLMACARAGAAPALDYQLQPRKIAADTYVFVGKTEDFTPQNGGNIVNTGFVVTRDGVVVIDSGPSKLYGEQMRKAIAVVTPLPINRVLNTHHHPDHFFGNQAFADVPICALADTIAGMKQDGGAFADNLYRMSGDWMKGTEPQPASRAVEPGRFSLGGHDFELIAMRGHTHGDLVLFDHTTGVLFAGDLVFFQRAPTTPHADIRDWLDSLNKLQQMKFRLLVPGHGEPVTDARAIEQTRRYLGWLSSRLQQAALDGLDMPELLTLPIPTAFAGIPLVGSEYQRSIAHLYRQIELPTLDHASTTSFVGSPH